MVAMVREESGGDRGGEMGDAEIQSSTWTITEHLKVLIQVFHYFALRVL